MDETGLTSRAGTRGKVTAVLGFALAAYALYWVVGIVEPHVYRITFCCWSRSSP